LSDKPRELSAHTLRRHGESLLQFVQELELQDIVLVLQDWGGPIGAWMAARAAG
jgi:pimeloyl-ACP methyl ester carboxylesterase